MSKQKRALIVPAVMEEPCEARYINAVLEGIQPIVGGWIEAVSPADGNWHAYCDEEGKLKGLLFNRRATVLARELGWPIGDVIVGPAVFLGDTPSGNEGDVPKAVILKAVDLGCEVHDFTPDGEDVGVIEPREDVHDPRD